MTLRTRRTGSSRRAWSPPRAWTPRAWSLRRPAARAIASCALLLVLGPAAAACGSISAAGLSAGTRSSRAVAGCAAGSLRVTLDFHAAGVAAGTALFPLDFTNISRRSCHLTGYPAVSFATGTARRRIGTAAALDRSVRVRSVALAPGETAHAWLRVTDAQNYPASQCRPVTADGLRVDLPGQHSASFLSHAFPVCSAAMRGRAVLTVQPIQPGRARRGMA
jgi:Protein of unknown function (DUF4232)